MAKSRRKASGCKAGSFKVKKMGKGWLTLRKKRGTPAPVVRKSADEAKQD